LLLLLGHPVNAEQKKRENLLLSEDLQYYKKANSNGGKATNCRPTIGRRHDGSHGRPPWHDEHFERKAPPGLCSLQTHTQVLRYFDDFLGSLTGVVSIVVVGAIIYFFRF
jgi:hypothetical protein